MLIAQTLSKAYGSKQVLCGVNLHLGAGTYVLQGPNGIGKSTLLAILAGAVAPDAGQIRIAGACLRTAPALARARLSYVPDECPVYPFMTGRELLALVAHIKRCGRAPLGEVLEAFRLEEHLDTRFGEMSLGTQKKCMLAAACIGEPAVILMDEPSNGLDRAARAALCDLIRKRQATGVTLISTHDSEFAAAAGARVIAFESLTSGELVALP